MVPRSLAAFTAAAVTAAALAGAPGRAEAGEPIGFALDATFGGGMHVGELGAQSDRLAPYLRLGLGVTQGPWAGLVSVDMPAVFGLPEAQSAAQPTPPTLSFIGVGVGPSVRRELTRGDGLRAHVRLGYTWRWLYGDGQARRTCQVHGGCAGGFWLETPAYSADGPTVAIGLSGRMAGRSRDAHWVAVGAELSASYFHLDRTGADPDLTGMFVALGINVAIGRGAF